jgi:peroxiredoxin
MDLQVWPLDGAPPPAFTLEDLDGKKVSLAEYRGRPVVLYFWATW